MQSFCTITPTRGDRPELLAFCKRQIERMNPAPDMSFFIENDKVSKREAPDLITRIKNGIAAAKAAGYEIAYILEDDDWYPANYFEQMDIGNNDFIGCSKTTYYSLVNQSWMSWEHTGRSSLYNTGFRLSALDSFRWPPDDYVFLDIDLWSWAYQQRCRIKLIPAAIGIGIKHGMGVTGGKGHKQHFANVDTHWNFLKAHVDEEAFTFYQQLKAKLSC